MTQTEAESICEDLRHLRVKINISHRKTRLTQKILIFNSVFE